MSAPCARRLAARARARYASFVADDLAAVALRGAAERVPNLDTSLLEDVILGCAFPEGEQGMNLARIATALAGLPIDAGGTTVNRFCASSLQAVNMAAQSIMLGQGDLIIAGGVESMSRVPMGGFNPSFNPKLINNPVGIELCGMPGKLSNEFNQSYIPMGMTAENLAKQYNISREEQDKFALRSHQRALAAIDSGVFAREIVPVQLPDGTLFTTDEGPRRETSLEALAALQPAFIAGGSVTAGNSSPLNDGASGVVLDVGGEGARPGHPGEGAHHLDGGRWRRARGHGHRPGQGGHEGAGARQPPACGYRHHRAE